MSEEKKGRPEDYDEDEWAWHKFGPSAPGNNFDALSCAQHYYDMGYLSALGDVKEMLGKTFEFKDGCIDSYASEIYEEIDKLKSCVSSCEASRAGKEEPK